MVVMAVAMMLMAMVMRVIVVVVIVVLAHASFPVEGSAICSSISLSTPLIWASATV